VTCDDYVMTAAIIT